MTIHSESHKIYKHVKIITTLCPTAATFGAATSYNETHKKYIILWHLLKRVWN